MRQLRIFSQVGAASSQAAHRATPRGEFGETDSRVDAGILHTVIITRSHIEFTRDSRTIDVAET